MATVAVDELRGGPDGDARPQSQPTHPELTEKAADDSAKALSDEKQEKTRKAQEAERKKLGSAQEQRKVLAHKAEDGATPAAKTAVEDKLEKARRLREQQEQERIKKIEAQKHKDEGRSQAALEKKRELLLAAQKKQEERKLKCTEPLATKGTDEHMEKVKKAREQLELERKKRLEAQQVKEQQRTQGAEPLVAKGVPDEHMEKVKKAREQLELERKKRLEAQQLKEQQKMQAAIDKKKHLPAQTKPEDRSKPSANAPSVPVKKVASIPAHKRAAGSQHLPSRKAQPHSATAVHSELPQGNPLGADHPTTEGTEAAITSGTAPAGVEEGGGVVQRGGNGTTSEGTAHQPGEDSGSSVDVESVGDQHQEGEDAQRDVLGEIESQSSGGEGSRTSLDTEPPEAPNSSEQNRGTMEDRVRVRARNEQEAAERRKRVDEIIKKARAKDRRQLQPVQNVPASSEISVSAQDVTSGLGYCGDPPRDDPPCDDPPRDDTSVTCSGLSDVVQHVGDRGTSAPVDQSLPGSHLVSSVIVATAPQVDSSTPVPGPDTTLLHTVEPLANNGRTAGPDGGLNKEALCEGDVHLVEGDVHLVSLSHLQHESEPSNIPHSQHDQPIDGPHPQQDQPEGKPRPQQDQSNDGPHPQQDQSNDVPHPQQDQSNDGLHPQQDQSNDVPHPQQDQSDDVPHPQQDQSNDVPHPQQDQSNDVPHPQQDQSNDVPHPQQDQSNDVPHPQQDQSNDVPHPQQDQSSEGPHPQQDQSSEGHNGTTHLEHIGDRESPIDVEGHLPDLPTSDPPDDCLHHHSDIGGDHGTTTGGTAEAHEHEANKSSSSSVTFDEEGEGPNAVLKLLEDD